MKSSYLILLCAVYVMRRLLVLLLMLFSSFVDAQQNEIDSLKKILITEKENINKVKILNQITGRYLNTANYLQARPYVQQAVQLAEKLGLKEDLAIASDRMGVIFTYFGNYEKALENYLKALKYWEEIGDKQKIISIYYRIADVHQNQANYKEQLENCFKILKIEEKHRDTAGVANSYVHIADAYYIQCKQEIKEKDTVLANLYYDKVVDFSLKALKIWEHKKDSSEIASVLISLGFFYDKCNLFGESKLPPHSGLIKSDYYNKSLESYLKALKIYQKKGNEDHIMAVYYSLGVFYKNQGNLGLEQADILRANLKFKISLENYFKGLELIEKHGYKHGIANSSKEIGTVYLKLGKFTEADKYLVQAMNIFEEIGFREGLKDTYSKLTELYVKKNDHKAAFEYYKRYSNLKDTLLNEVSARLRTEMNTKYESDKKDQEIVFQKTEVSRQEARKNGIITAGVALFCIALLSFMLYRNNRLRKESGLSQQVSEIEMKALRSQMNPHFIFNALNSIQKFIREHPETAEGYLVKFSKLMREVLENSEKEAISLEEELSMLKKYMDLESLRIKGGFAYDVNIEPDIDEETVKIPPLILQPIVENAIKHGLSVKDERGRISLYISVDRRILQCVVENHCGGTQKIRVDQDEKRKSLGLQIVSQRLEMLGKEKKRKWYLESIPQKEGMKVSLGIPL